MAGSCMGGRKYSSLQVGGQKLWMAAGRALSSELKDNDLLQKPGAACTSESPAQAGEQVARFPAAHELSMQKLRGLWMSLT